MNTEASKNAHIVIIDDEEAVCRSYVDALVWGCGFNFEAIHCFTDPREALVYVRESYRAIDVVLLDLKMPHIDGLDMLRHIRNIDENLKIIVISAFAGIDSVKKAVNTFDETDILEKAVDKPVKNFPALASMIEAAYRQRRSD